MAQKRVGLDLEYDKKTKPVRPEAERSLPSENLHLIFDVRLKSHSIEPALHDGGGVGRQFR